MPLDSFAPPLAPSPQSSRPVKPRTKAAQFGDGYSQRSSDGLNTVVRSFQPQWPDLKVTDADIIEAFLEAHTVTPFLWAPPLEVVARKWIAADWSRGYAGADFVSLTATFTEVFDL